ncbi:MAG: hypothetical protein IKU72_01985 [Oscillospiraceae bacterium]|nr:hypothetical protein [Oscillospiraceae bacterium]
MDYNSGRIVFQGGLWDFDENKEQMFDYCGPVYGTEWGINADEYAQ